MLDLDGIIYQYSPSARFLLEHEFGITISHPPRYWDHLKDQITSEQWAWLWTEGIERGLFRHGHCFKGSFEAIRVLDEIGDIVIITHRPKSALQDTQDWLAFNRIPASTVHLLYREEKKSSVRPFCDIYLDDKVANCLDLLENTPGLVCLWNRPWNEDEQATLPKDILVINSWIDFISAAKEQKAWTSQN